MVVRHRTNIRAIGDDLLATLVVATAVRATHRIIIAIPATAAAIARMHGPWSAIADQDRFVMPTIDWEARRSEIPRRIVINRNRNPRDVAHGRTPAPAAATDKNPRAVAVRRPSPRISRDPDVSGTGIPDPRAVSERLPGESDKIGSPDPTIDRHNFIRAPISKIGVAIRICRVVGIRAGREI